MRKVFGSHSDVAHAWANKTQSEGRASSIFFEDDVIYSYGRHFQIAKHVTNSKGENAILFTERGYSNSTAKHIIRVRNAASHLNFIYVPDPANYPALNFAQWRMKAENVASSLTTARKPEIYLSQLGIISNAVNKYAEFFGLDIPEDLQAVLSIGDKTQYKQYAEQKAAFEKARQEKEQRELLVQHKKELNKWLNFETHALLIRNGHDYLRFNATESRVETTQGVKIPVEIARRLYNDIKADELKPGSKFLNYIVSEVDAKHVRIGCHNFETKYLIEFGNKIFQTVN